MPHSDMVKLVRSRIPRAVTEACNAGLIGREVMENAVRAAGWHLVTSQDESIDLRKYLEKLESAVDELIATLCPYAR